jgi:outer membrane lipoprotein-sorting protein
MRLVGLLSAVLFALPVARASAADVEEVDRCVRGNLPEKSSIQTVELVTRDRTGSKRTLAGEIKWKVFPKELSRTLIAIESPPDVRGSAYLMIEKEAGDEMFVFLPDMGRVRRIHPSSASGSLFGTDFSYEDLRYLQRISGQAGAERLADAEEAGRKLFVIRVVPSATEQSAYQKIVAFVDQQNCVPLKIEFYDKGGDLQKVVAVDPETIRREGRGWMPHTVSIKDLRNESETRLQVRKIQLDPQIDDRVFTVTALERRH